MSKLNIDQQTIKELFTNKRADFLIPDYQRPYAWDISECQTLWDDIFLFAFPDDDFSKFDPEGDEYFLGPIVTFKNSDNKLEIIDGQQRLTTLMLLLRAFYSFFGNMKDDNSKKTAEDISKCIWKTDEFGTPDINKLKIDSEVTSDDDKDEFLSILKTGIVVDSQKSAYARNYRFFTKQINTFLVQYPTYFAYLPNRLMNNCILLPIEAESQETALRIFSTLNDRGKPLSDTDIFKAQFYKYYKENDKKDEFIKRWKQLEEISDKIFSSVSGSSMDELFTRYMYYERAKMKNKNTTTEALRKFYEKDGYSLLKKDETLTNLEALASFWVNVAEQDDSVFSDKVLKNLSVLNYAPNGMWAYLTSVYFMQNKDSNGMLEDKSFGEFLDIVNNQQVSFNDYKFDESDVKLALENYLFTNGRPITKSMLAWWMYTNDKQDLFLLDTKVEIEHIYAKKRQENENGLTDKRNLESLGNKALLEKAINIRASDYRFIDKLKYYKGFETDKGKVREGTKNKELFDLASNSNDFKETNIVARKSLIISTFIDYLRQNDLLLK